MRKYLCFFALLPFTLVSSAQGKLTQASFREMFNEYGNDSNAFFINRLSEAFRYSTPDGKLLRKTDVARVGGQAGVSASSAQIVVATIAGIKTMLQHMLATDILDPVIHQSADLAVVSGRHKATWIGNEGKEMTGEVAGTYTFKKKKGNWIFVAAHQTSLAE